MSVNSTSDFLLDYNCFTLNSHISIAFTALKSILLLPLYTLILYLGHQRWQQQRSFERASHSDIFTYHMAGMELIWVLGCIYYCCGTNTNESVMKNVGFVVSISASYGEVCFHVLTCVERYLAVVQPITYLGLRNARGVRIRNISTGCVWLLCLGLTGVISVLPPDYDSVPVFFILGFPIVTISFCSLSVLCVLISPGPGEGGKEMERVDQSKLRAFYTITVITCTVWLWFVGVLISSALIKSPTLNSNVKCLVLMSAVWFNLPCCLVLPLLYLRRAGKLPFCCNEIK